MPAGTDSPIRAATETTHVSRAEEAASKANRLLTFGLLGILCLGELVVVATMSIVAGAVLLGCTAGLVAVSLRTKKQDAVLRERVLHTVVQGSVDSFHHDAQTGLPNRQLLMDQLVRDIARARRYSQEITLVVVEIARVQDLQAAWGPQTIDRAVLHVAETLQRVTRNSDFLARIDDERFAVLLMQCTAEQAKIFGERALLAVSNRPLKPGEGNRVPVYVSVEYSAVQYDPEQFRGPLDFLSAAGGDLQTPSERQRPAVVGGAPGRKSAADPRSLRQQLVRDYYPEGKIQDFAEAYKSFRTHRTG